ncbi:phage tail length tape measure family protein [Paracoccus aminovorans]|uniref:phage tail length tape measure family protein n=1 Tax=Paracoccus aminovorans TaxID=34004 RepID=UPI000784DC28|nr:phage tail length tape measure family protein [Paracoccus aminovorans]
MTDFAKLVLAADATGLKQGEQALDSLAAKGAQVEGRLGGAMKRTASDLREAGAAAKAAGTEIQAAAGQTGILVSQFNDIAVMMAAGQSPIQLAMQQGTQISQVLVTMGGGVGAVKALGAAFMGMLNPVSLLTIGSVAMGAAFSQALTGMIPETKDFGEAIDDLNEAIDQARSNLDLFADGGKKLAEIYGGVSDEVRDLASAIAQVDLRKMNDAARTAAGSLSRDYNGSGWGNVSRREDMANGLGLRGDALNQTASLADALGSVDTMGERLAILTKMRETLAEALGDAEQMDDAQAAYFASVVEAEKAARRALEVTRDTAAAEKSLADAKIAAAYAYAGETMRLGAAMRADVDQRIKSLSTEAEIQRLVALYGADSEAATRARADAERDALAETLEAKGITGELADEVLRAYDATVDSANATADWAVTMSAVRAEIGAIASALASMGGGAIANAGKFAELTALRQGRTIAEAARERQRLQMEAEFTAREAAAGTWVERMLIRGERGLAERGMELDAELDEARDSARERERAASRKGGSGGRKGRGGSGRRERANEYERSVQDIQAETEAFLRQADALAKVTAAGGDWEHALAVIEEEQKLLNAAQKAGVELTPEIREGIRGMAEDYVNAEEQLERIRTATEKGQDVMKDFFGSMLDGADAAKEALANLLAEIAKVQFAKGMLGLMGGTSWGAAIIKGIGGLTDESYDGGGWTGPGSRTGGVDGLGGRYAIIHPNETIYDHTKGQSAGGVIRVEIDKSPYFDARVTQIADRSSANMGKAVSASIKPTVQQYQVNPRKNR